MEDALTPAFILLLACAGNKTVESSPAPAAVTPTPQPAAQPAPPAKPGLTTVVAGRSRAAPSAAFAPRAIGFARRFHEGLATDGNAVTSGVSASFALGMLAEGATDDTAAAFVRLFGDELEPVQVDHTRALAAYNDTMGVDLTVVNGLWPDEGHALSEPVLGRLASVFNARAQPLPFTSNPTEAAAQLDRWTAKNTGGLIDKLFTPDQIAGSSLVLANAIAFKGQWQDPFDVANTRPAPFAVPEGTADVPTMHRTRALVSYTEGVGYQAVMLPYAQGMTSMAIILPAEGKTLADAADGLAADNLLAMAASPPQYTNLALPRFKVSSEHDLKEHASDIGLQDVFGGSYEKFGGLLVDQAIQKVVVEVNEEGAEAAAVTAVGMKRASLPRTMEFNVNRPFLFAIWHVETRTPLFIGQVVDPR